MSGHVHEFELQRVCETCGHRESLPEGRWLTAEQVAQVLEIVQRERDEIEAITRPMVPHIAAVYLAKHDVALALLAGDQP